MPSIHPRKGIHESMVKLRGLSAIRGSAAPTPENRRYPRRWQWRRLHRRL